MKVLFALSPFLLSLLLSGCCGGSKEPPKKTTTTVVTPGSGGNWHGDAKACAAVKACCSASSDVSLFCSLSEAGQDVKGDCSKGLPKIRAYITEAKKAPPPGCM